MAAVLLLLAMIASTATTVTPDNTKAADTQQSSGEAIHTAQTFHNRVFTGYVLLLILTVFGTYFVWSSGNRVQDAVQAEANARIEEAKRAAAEAEKDASEARKETAILQKQTVELRKEQIKQGHKEPLLRAQMTSVVNQLKPFPGSKIEIRYCLTVANNRNVEDDAWKVAQLLRDIVKEANWVVNPTPLRVNCFGAGLQVSVNPNASKSARRAAEALHSALRRVPLNFEKDRVQEIKSDPSADDDTVIATVLGPL
jgi:hypothetical protein